MILNNHHKLYLSHALTSWVDRSFEFASYLLISKIYTSSLLQSSIYGLTTTLAALVLSNQIGNWINILSRLNTYRVTLLVQKISIVVSTVLFYYLFVLNTNNNDGNVKDSGRTLHGSSNGLYAVIIVLGCTLKLSFIGNSIAIEKDWAFIISEGHLEVLLPTMRRIDLVCKTVSPIFVGFLLAAPSHLIATIVICAWTTVSAVVEYILVSQIHNDVPALHSRTPYTPPTPTTSATPTESEHQEQEEEASAPVSLREYIHHKTFLITLSVGMLYINVLSFGGTMTSYLTMIGYSNSLLGIMKAVAGIMGVAGTYAQPLLSKRIGNVRTGLWSIWQLSLTLSLVLIAIANKAHDTPTTTSVLLFGGVAASRLGLWMFDLAESLILQEYTSSSHITSITGWQYSMCNLFDLLQYVLTIVWSDPAMFVVPASISVGVVVAAAGVYTGFVWKDRGHLLHHIKLK
ncbi:Ferroporti-1 [Linnemannia elongata]|nr:Ferroporti-1 [Linnemannia elongata]